MSMRIGIGIGLPCRRPDGGGSTDTTLHVTLRDGTFVTDHVGTQVTVRETS